MYIKHYLSKKTKPKNAANISRVSSNSRRSVKSNYSILSRKNYKGLRQRKRRDKENIRSK